jgi:hypothetical protein
MKPEELRELTDEIAANGSRDPDPQTTEAKGVLHDCRRHPRR